MSGAPLSSPGETGTVSLPVCTVIITDTFALANVPVVSPPLSRCVHFQSELCELALRKEDAARVLRRVFAGREVGQHPCLYIHRDHSRIIQATSLDMVSGDIRSHHARMHRNDEDVLSR